MSSDNTTITAVDGTDALAFVIIRPGSQEGGVSIEAAANGMSKAAAAYVLRHVADQFDKDAAAEERPCEKCEQPRPLFTFSYVPIGWSEFKEVELCARCHSAATVADENGGIPYHTFTSERAR